MFCSRHTFLWPYIWSNVELFSETGPFDMPSFYDHIWSHVELFSETGPFESPLLLYTPLYVVMDCHGVYRYRQK